MKVLHIHRNIAIHVPMKLRDKSIEVAVQSQIDFHQKELDFWIKYRDELKISRK